MNIVLKFQQWGPCHSSLNSIIYCLKRSMYINKQSTVQLLKSNKISKNADISARIREKIRTYKPIHINQRRHTGDKY